MLQDKGLRGHTQSWLGLGEVRQAEDANAALREALNTDFSAPVQGGTQGSGRNRVQKARGLGSEAVSAASGLV